MDEATLKTVIGRLMQQVDEEKRLRIEAVRVSVNLPPLQPFVAKIPTDEEIERRIQELS